MRALALLLCLCAFAPAGPLLFLGAKVCPVSGPPLEKGVVAVDGGRPGMKMADGENPKRDDGSRDKSPMARMNVTALQREILLEEIACRGKLARYAGKPGGDPLENPCPGDAVDFGVRLAFRRGAGVR